MKRHFAIAARLTTSHFHLVRMKPRILCGSLIMSKTDKPALSKRELEVLQEVAKGYSNQEIARELVISMNTVRVHLRNIFGKLEVQSRTEATMWAVKEGLLTPPQSAEEAEAEDDDDDEIMPMPSLGVPRLISWQRIYLAVAVAITLIVFATPLIRPIFSARSKGAIPPPPLNASSSAPPVINSRWIRQGEISTPRSQMALLAWQGKLYLIGGERSSGVTGLVEVFDPVSKSWQEIAGKPTLGKDIQGVIISDKILVAGGCDNEGQPANALEIFDLNANIWRSDAQEMPEALCAYAATAYNGELYVIGGWNGKKYVDSVYVYNPQQNEWRQLEQPYPLQAGYASAIAVGGELLVAGGYDDQKEFSSVYIFDDKSGQWREGPPLIHPRGGLSLAMAGDNLYAIGGGMDAPLAVNEKLNLEEMTWQEIETPYLDQWRTYGAAAIGSELFSVGGWNKEYPATLLSYQTVYKIFIPLSP